MSELTIHSFLIFSVFLVICGIFGIIRHVSLFGMLFSTELIFLGAALNFSVFDKFIFNSKSEGQLFSFVIIVISISSIVVIASFILTYYRDEKTIDSDLPKNEDFIQDDR